MKKIGILLAAFTIGIFSQAGAQSFYLGPQASFGHSWLNNMGENEFKATIGLGISALYMHNDNLGMSATLSLSNEGYRTDIPVEVNNGLRANTTTINPMYLRFTPKAVYMFGDKWTKVRPVFAIGPSVAYKLDEVHWVNEYKMDAKEVLGNGRNDSRAPELIDDFDAGVDIDAGVRFQVGRNAWLNTSLGYYHGLMDVRDFEESENRNLRAIVGVMFGL